VKDIDVLVAYIVPEDLWYVLPITAFRGIKGMKLFPSSRRRMSKYEVYREGWELLGGRVSVPQNLKARHCKAISLS
jgi:hypothetical protein